MRIRHLFLAFLLLPNLLLAQCVLSLRPGPAQGEDTQILGMNCTTSTWSQQTGNCDTTNFGGHDRAFAAAWTWLGNPGTLRSLLRFDLDSLANAGCSVGQATLTLYPEPGYFEYNCGSGSTLHPCQDNALRVNRVSSPWTEMGVTWATQPTVASSLPGIDQVIVPNDADPYDPTVVDLTDMVNFWLANPTQNHGMRIALLAEAIYSRRHFCTSDHANPALWPRLELSLNCPGSCDRLLQGRIYDDTANDCIYTSPNDNLMPSWIVEINPGPFYANTDANGNWQAWVGNAPSYTVTQHMPNHVLWDSVCPMPYQHVLNGLAAGSTTTGLDFAVTADAYCAMPIVDIVGGFLRPCHVSPYHVQYCNNGNDMLYGAYVTVHADPAVTFLSSSLAWDIPQSGLDYIFQVGDLAPGQCGSFTINAQVSCSTVIGQAICVQAEIAPIDSCVFAPIDSAWDRSSVQVSGGCVGDSLVCFTILNTGSPVNGNMTAPSQYRIYDNGVLVFTGTFQLCGGCSTQICWPANGHTIRLEADQRPGHPGNSHPNANVEDCGSSPASRGFITAMPQDDADPQVEIFCDVVVNSYDPNDKLNAPEGIGADHITAPGAPMEYTIRFQNTGTAPAIDVIIKDTLASTLDPTTLSIGAGSHPFTWHLHGHGILEFRFLGINLPDSNANEPASHGFVKFGIQQKPGLPLGTRIENSAAIYFDNNAPVITPIAFNTLGLPTSASPAASPGSGLSLWPNPTRDRLSIRWEQSGPAQLSLMDLTGRTLSRRAALNSAELDVSSLPAGVYLVRVEAGGRATVARFVKH